MEAVVKQNQVFPCVKISTDGQCVALFNSPTQAWVLFSEGPGIGLGDVLTSDKHFVTFNGVLKVETPDPAPAAFPRIMNRIAVGHHVVLFTSESEGVLLADVQGRPGFYSGCWSKLYKPFNGLLNISHSPKLEISVGELPARSSVTAIHSRTNPQPQDYPRVKIHEDGTVVVFTDSYGNGSVVVSGDLEYKHGHVVHNWVESSFEDFHGSIEFK